MTYLKALVGGMGRGVLYCTFVAVLAIVLSLH
jgi:hypothetical protein